MPTSTITNKLMITVENLVNCFIWFPFANGDDYQARMNDINSKKQMYVQLRIDGTCIHETD
ncbi:MAG: hypothetical protein CMM01_21185 [Rhodopirellula sp.]|nr:hypothetical protein [Rhodopirellula sp.]OUX49575.1 MAG: hypothetical protein CBE43_09680 [Rhodopirellula sp. TMED283]